ncbi:MAG: Gfo/Idh/MocA family oxidoreductase [Planctomycetota bacterium]|nr:Gfo/Idh/MocA family oxidoreductase [Planctomycetota bacterium]
MIRIAVAGAGQWGRNHVRVLAALPGARLTWVADPDDERRAAASVIAPRARMTTDLGEALADPDLDAVVVASPGSTHHAVARQVIDAGKHLLVEKPLTTASDTSWDLVRRARRRGVLLAVGHLLLYHPAVRALKRAVSARSFGAVRYMHCTRTNLGRIRPTEGALESLAPHDISVMVHLLEQWPVAVSAQGARHVQPRFHDVVFLHLRFPGNVLAQIHLSWLEPLKVRRVSVVGERGMAVFDDMAADGKVQVLHAKIPPVPGRPGGPPGHPTRVTYPRIAVREPLVEELKAFVRCVRTGTAPLTPGEDGARSMRVLEAAQASLDDGGREVRLRIR